MQKEAMMQTMKLVKYKYFSVNLKKKIKEKENKIKELEDEIKKIKTLINKSKRISCQKYFTKLQNMKNTQSKIKPLKIGKELETIYCLGFKDFTHNFRPEEVKRTNKVLKEKSNCFICRSNKSRFFKQ